MRAIIKISLFALPVLLFTHCEWFGEDEPDNNDPVNIPDTTFLNALISEGVDVNNDSLISYSEAESVDGLAIWGGSDIVDLKGIEAFINLEDLFIDGTGFSEVSFSKNTKLESLVIRVRYTTWPMACGNLETVDLSKNARLTSLSITFQNLSFLDISNNTRLTEIYIDDNANLTQVCVWTTPFPPEGVIIDTEGSPNVSFTADCGN